MWCKLLMSLGAKMTGYRSNETVYPYKFLRKKIKMGRSYACIFKG